MSSDDLLSQSFSACKLSPSDNKSTTFDSSHVFQKMYTDETKINMSTLEDAIEMMKEKAMTSISFPELMMFLAGNTHKENEPDQSSAPEDPVHTPKVSTPEDSDGASISSSVDSSWSKASLDSPVHKFSFKTPQKLFTFEEPRAKNKSSQPEKELSTDQTSRSLFGSFNDTKGPGHVKKECSIDQTNKTPFGPFTDTKGSDPVNKEPSTEQTNRTLFGSFNDTKGSDPVNKEPSTEQTNRTLFGSFNDTKGSDPANKEPSTDQTNRTLFGSFNDTNGQGPASWRGVPYTGKSPFSEGNDNAPSNPPIPSFALGSSSQTNSGKNRGKASRRRQHQPKENKQNHESKPANTLPAQSFAFGSGSGEKKFSFGGSPASFSQEGEEMDIGTTETQPDPPVNPTTPFRKKIPASSKKKKSAVGTATGSKSHRKNSAQSSHAMQELDNMFARIQVDGLSSGDDVGAGVEGRDQQAQRPFFYFPADSNDERRDAESEASRATNQERNDMGKNDPNDRIDEVTMKMSELAESYKIQGKKDYSSQHYDLAYDSFTKALDAAPPQWREKANVLSNRAAALIMMERLVEAIQDCEAATVVDPEFVKVHSRRGRAYLKLGKIEEATDAFMLVLGWTVSTEESNANDKFGREIARQAMKQVVLAKTLRDRLVNASKSNVKQNLQTAEELLALCPYMREAQTHKARALCQQHKWDEAKHFMEYCVCAIHPSMQKLHAHSCTELSLVKLENLSWHVDSSGVLRVRTDAVCMALLSMGSSMAQCYLTTLKNQAICRTSCSADVMLRLTEVLNAAIDRTFQPHTTSTVDIGWDWVVSELSKIQLIISIKNDADSKFRSGMFVEAIQRYGDVLQVDPDAHVWNAIMFGNKAASAMRLGLFSEAVSDCHQSLARDPEYSRAYLRRARAQRALGNHSASVRDYRKYLKSVPKPPDATSVEEELLEVLRAKSDEERCRRGAPNWNSNGRGPTYESRENYDTRGNARSQQEKPSSSYYAYRESGAHKNRKKTTPQKNERQEKGHSQGKQIEPEVTSANYYRRLGLHVTATDQEIKAAYRKMALKFHPDKNKDEGAAEIFKSVTEAYSVLTDKSNRRMYDDANTYGRESRRSRR